MGNDTPSGRTGFGNTLFAGLTGGTFDENETLDKEFRYNGSLQRKTSAIRDRYNGVNQWQSLVPTIAMNGIISGSLGTTSLQNLATMTQQTTIADIDTAWIMATQSTSPIFDILFQNGKYEVYIIQRKASSTTYTPYIDWCTVWDTELTETTKDDVLRDVAFLGFWFSEDATVARTGKTGIACDSSLMHIPVFDRNGVTTGEWKSGTDAAQEPNASWNNPYEDNPYTPSGGGDNDDFGDLENIFGRRRYPTCLNVYVTNNLQYGAFVEAVNGIYASNPDGVTQWTLDFNGANPSDYIVSSFVTPLVLPTLSNPTTIKLGNITTPFQNISVLAYDTSADGVFDCGSIQFNAYYNDFRDYAPYTTAQIYIPLCGTVDIEPEFFVGHSVNVVYFYDVLTMSLAAGIYRDAYTLYKVVNGSAGAEIPLTSMRMGDYQNAIHNIEQSLKRSDFNIAMSTFTSGASLVGAVASGGASLATGAGIIGGGSGLISNLMAKQDLQYQMQHTVPKPSGTTAAEAQNGFCVGGLYPILFIKRAKMQSGYDADIYSHTVGNACLIQSKIKDMSGLIKCSNVDLSGIPATADEITAIQTALQNGIYV